MRSGSIRSHPSHRGLSAAAASVALAASGILMCPSAMAAPTPTPTTGLSIPEPSQSEAAGATLPVPTGKLDPALTVGGPKLAGMGVIVDRPPTVPPPPVMRDVSWVVADMVSGDIVAAKAPHARLLPASTLKTLTALVLLRLISPTASYVASDADARADGTRVGIVPGLSYSGRDLFNAMLMSSANDADYALSRIAGGIPKTLAAMNATAAELGAHDTVARDPAGLDMKGQTSSAYDLALIGRAAMQRPDFRRYVVTKMAKFPGNKTASGTRSTYVINSHNTLLYNYPGTIGVKNGYTVAAHRTFISAVTRNGHTYLITEMYGLNSSWRPTAALYDWAFAYGDQVTPVGRLVEPGEVTRPPTASPSPTPTGEATGTDAGQQEAGGQGQDLGGRTPGRARALFSMESAPLMGAGAVVAAALLVVLLALRSRARRRRRRRRYSSRHAHGAS